jgi:hypothetical protein
VRYSQTYGAELSFNQKAVRWITSRIAIVTTEINSFFIFEVCNEYGIVIKTFTESTDAIGGAPRDY